MRRALRVVVAGSSVPANFHMAADSATPRPVAPTNSSSEWILESFVGRNSQVCKPPRQFAEWNLARSMASIGLASNPASHICIAPRQRTTFAT